MAFKDLRTSICVNDLQSLVQDVIYNSQVTQDNTTQLITIVEGGSVTDTYKLFVNGADTAPDYLHAKVEQAGATSDAHYLPVRSETVTDATELFYLDVQEVPGYDAATQKFLSTDPGTGEPILVELGSVADDKKVFCSATDTTASYLHDALDYGVAYVEDADILVGNATLNSGANETEQLFVDVSSILGYLSTGTLLLCLVDNVTSYLDSSAIVSAGTTAGYALDRSSSTLSFDPTEITGFTSQFQFFMHLSTASAATDPAWRTVSGYDATKNQIWWHQSGTFVFQTVTDYDITISQYLGHHEGNWKFFEAEKFRSIRGLTVGAVASTLSPFTIDNINPLESGKDPRTNTSSATETVQVYNIPSEAHPDNDDVWADYNEVLGHWEARPRGGTRHARVTTAITRASGPLAAQKGTGVVKLQDPVTGVVSSTTTNVENWNIDATHGFPVDAQVTLDMRYNPPRVIGGTCSALTGVWS